MTRMQTLLATTLALLTFNGYADSTDRAIERKADAMEERADAVRERGAERADAIEDADPGLLNSESTENAADSTRDASEARADALEERADDLRDAK